MLIILIYSPSLLLECARFLELFNGHCMFILMNSIWLLLNGKIKPFQFEYFSRCVDIVRSGWFSFLFSSPSALQKFIYNFKSKNRNFKRTKMVHSMVNIGSVFLNLWNVSLNWFRLIFESAPITTHWCNLYGNENSNSEIEKNIQWFVWMDQHLAKTLIVVKSSRLY